MENSQLKSRLGVRALKSKKCLEWLQDSDTLPDRKIICLPMDKAKPLVQGKSSIGKHLKKSMFNECRDLMLRKLGSEQVHQTLCAYFVVQMFGLKDK